MEHEIVDFYLPNDLTEEETQYVMTELHQKTEQGIITGENCVLVEKFEDGTIRFVMLWKSQVEALATAKGCHPRDVIMSALVGEAKRQVLN